MNVMRAVAAPCSVLLLSLAGCSSTGEPAPPQEQQPPPLTAAREKEVLAPVLEDLGTHHRAITTTSPEAQRQFDRGLIYTYAFNHADAIAAFTSAVDADPHCAMAWWGIALANGPHINNPVMDEQHWKDAWEALSKARLHASGHANPTERALITALWRRYTKVYTTDRRALEQAYALAMREVWNEHKDDPDVGTLFAESLLQCHPWDQWTPDGKAKEDTDEIVATLEAVLLLQPNNPGANHLYIHAIEGSPSPAKADVAADRLRVLVPDAGHLLHMPAHIDVRVGRWAQASDTNEKAIAADERKKARVSRTGFYRIYMAHNRHFLSYAASMEGRFAVALDAARKMVGQFPQELIDAAGPELDAFLPTALHVLVRFGRWEDVLKEPEPPESFLVSRAVWHYARGVSLAALGKLDDAERESAALAAIAAKMDERTMGNNKATAVLPIPQKTLAAEIAFRRGKTDEALALLREAVPLQDVLVYDEPPSWTHPVRHVLAATLLAAKKNDEAEKVLREDLEHLPHNGWALVGLVTCLKARGATKEAAEAEARLAKAWSRSDMKIKSPCLCQPGE